MHRSIYKSTRIFETYFTRPGNVSDAFKCWWKAGSSEFYSESTLSVLSLFLCRTGKDVIYVENGIPHHSFFNTPKFFMDIQCIFESYRCDYMVLKTTTRWRNGSLAGQTGSQTKRQEGASRWTCLRSKQKLNLHALLSDYKYF